MARCIPKAKVGSMCTGKPGKALARSCTSRLRRIHRSTSRSIEINSSFSLILIVHIKQWRSYISRYGNLLDPGPFRVRVLNRVWREVKRKTRMKRNVSSSFRFEILYSIVFRGFLEIPIVDGDVMARNRCIYFFFPFLPFFLERCYVMPRNDVIVCYVVSVNLKAGIDEWSLYSVLAFLLRLDGREGDKWESLFPLWKRDALYSASYNINIARHTILNLY